MSFASPLFFWFAALSGAIVVLYILKVRRRRVTVPYLALWQSLVTETRARSLFQRLKRLLSLLLQLLILMTLVLALTRPAFDLRNVKAEHVVVLLDVSASMQAVEEDGRTRFDELLEKARLLVDERSFEDAMMLVAVSDRIDVLSPFSKNTLRLRDALGRAAPTNRPFDAERALAFAREATRDVEHPVILFVSDGAAGKVAGAIGARDEPAGSAGPDAPDSPDSPGPAGAAENERDAHLIPVGTPRENVGIVRFSARKNSSLATDYVLAVVKNFGDLEHSFQLELRINGQRDKVLERTLGPREELTERFQLNLPLGGTLELVLTHPEEGLDALAVDDRAYAIVRPDRLRNVILVTETLDEAEPFRIAFASMSEMIDVERSAAVTLEGYAELEPEQRVADVTICLGVVPDELPRDGNLILMDTPIPPGLPAEILGEEERPRVWDWDREHLLNRYLNYRELALPPARTLRLAGGEVLVESFDGPLIAAFDQLGQTGRRVVYIAFDMTESLFPFRLAFPMLLRNAIAWFEVEEEVLFEDTYAPGSTITPLRGIGDQPVTATWFEGGESRTEALEPQLGGRFYFDRTEEPGPFLFQVGGIDYGTCVNLFDPAESDLMPPAPAGGEEGELVDRSSSFLNRELWTYLALLALLLWGTEWALYHRRITE